MSERLSIPGRLGKMGRSFTRGAPIIGRTHARAYKLTRGRLFKRWFGAPVMLLEAPGRKSGKPRETTVLCLRDGPGRYAVVGSNGGSDRPPAWWLNAEAAGRATLTVDGRRFPATLRVTDGDERERLWRGFVDMYPAADEYTRFTSRRFPIGVFEAEN